jgi:hypothetical protein
MFDGVKIFLPPNRMLVFGFLVFKKWVPYLKISLTPNNYRFLPSFITRVTEYRIPSYASNQNCDETGDGNLDKVRPKKKCLHDKISLQINMMMKVTTFSAVLLTFIHRPVFIHALTTLPEKKNCKHL